MYGGLVCLTRVQKGWFYYKDMDETMGPYAYKCPEKILRMLTPTDNENANEWRDKCWAILEKQKNMPKLRVGMMLKTNTPVEFRRGDKVQNFIVRSTQPLRFFNIAEIGMLYRMPRSYLDQVGYTELKPEQAIKEKLYPIASPKVQMLMLKAKTNEEIGKILWDNKKEVDENYLSRQGIYNWLYCFRPDMKPEQVDAQKVQNAYINLRNEGKGKKEGYKRYRGIS